MCTCGSNVRSWPRRLCLLLVCVEKAALDEDAVDEVDGAGWGTDVVWDTAVACGGDVSMTHCNAVRYLSCISSTTLSGLPSPVNIESNTERIQTAITLQYSSIHQR